MKINSIVAFACFLIFQNMAAQNSKPLTLKETVRLALKNSDEAKISESAVLIAENKRKVLENNRYPDVGISGQYMYLANADFDLKIDNSSGNEPADEESEPTQMPDAHQLLLGQAKISLPVFSGFRLKNSLRAENHRYKAEVFANEFDREEISLFAAKNYIELYKAEQAVKLMEENLKSSTQRVKDFTAMEENGLLARNDLLKAELQKSTIELNLEEAKKNKFILNFQLATFLKLPEGTIIDVEEPSLGIVPLTPISVDSLERGDVRSVRNEVLAAEDMVQVAKADYFPSLSLSAGYIALDLQNTLSITNAMNVGLGISYNLSNIFKNKNEVQLAKSKVRELKFSLNKKMDQARLEIENARQEYQLALKKFDVYSKSNEQASENYRIVKDKYDNGLQDTNDLLEADVQQLKAKMELAYAKADIALKYYELQKALGTLADQFTNK